MRGQPSERVCYGAFPPAIGVASTWDPELDRRLADAVRTQMRATGSHQGLAPVLNVARDPRWGRTEETDGEDPYLVSRMGVAFVRGLQGKSLADGVIATAKHLVGYGASERGMNWALTLDVPDAELTRRTAWRVPAAAPAGGYDWLYLNHVQQADKGADFDFLVGRRGAAVPRDSH